jgi:hypothetical protein
LKRNFNHSLLWLLAFLSACKLGSGDKRDNKEVVTQEINCASLQGKWQLATISSLNQHTIRTNQVLISDGNCGFKYNLEVNQCGLLFDLIGNDSILFYPPMCTEACCDSEYSQNIISVLCQMTYIQSYSRDSILLVGQVSPEVWSSISFKSINVKSARAEVKLQRVK